LVDDVEVVSLDEVRAAMDAALLGNHLLIEGAAGAALAAAARRTRSSVCAVISGGNIDPALHHAQLRARA
jgi:threonine dehydratase